MKKYGFTLVELLLVVSIVAILAILAVGTINPGALNGKANDAKRKKDIGRIKVAFEEYYSDKGCYPTGALLTDLLDKDNCYKNVFGFIQLEPWLCDPVYKTPYKIVVESTGCPKWFKVFTSLDNKNDGDIPVGWIKSSGLHVGNGEYSNLEVNYGGSSTNVNWYDFALDPMCDVTGKTYMCSYKKDDGSCNYADKGECDQTSYPNNCYATAQGSCDPKCLVPKCPYP